MQESQACNFIKKETLAQVFSWEFCEISKNTFCYRKHLVAASVALQYISPKSSKNTKLIKVKGLTLEGVFASRTKNPFYILKFLKNDFWFDAYN